MKQIGQRKGRMRGAFAALLIGASLLLGGCLVNPPVSPTVTHVILMWLKHPDRPRDRAQIIRAANSLRMIPGVLQVQAGGTMPPIGPHAPRDFDLGVVITFRDRVALQRYEKDPRHPGAMRRYLRPLVRRYEVYNLSDR